jgi:hypothetical protein
MSDWDAIKRKAPRHERRAMNAVERMTDAEREALFRLYNAGDKRTQAKLETLVNVAAMWKMMQGSQP